MPEKKEEIYSIMFSSLKHPARRKILRVLADKPLAFSQMLELLGISSSNLTYHLENLGELVSKDEQGVYRLSTFGHAAVNTMKIVEEAPQVTPKRRTALTRKWSVVTGVLLIALIVFASFATLQSGALNQMTSERDTLQTRYNQLLAWTSTTDDAITFLKDVVQLDLSKYQATLLDRTVESRSDLGGVPQENIRYSLTSTDGGSTMGIYFNFRNKQLYRYQLVVEEGAPIYHTGQSHSVLDAAKGVVDRFKAFENGDYLANMSELLTMVGNEQVTEIKAGNLKLNATISEDNSEFIMMYTENGYDYTPKGLDLVYEGRTLTELTNGWYLFSIGSTDVSISSERAVELAKQSLAGYSWTAMGQTVSSFSVMPQPASVIFHPNTRNDVALYPQWTITFYLDRVYPGDVYSIQVQIWADSGKVASIQTKNT